MYRLYGEKGKENSPIRQFWDFLYADVRCHICLQTYIDWEEIFFWTISEEVMTSLLLRVFFRSWRR